MNEEVEDLKVIIEQAQELYRKGEQLEAIDWLKRNYEDTAPADIQASQLDLNLGLMLVNYCKDNKYPYFEDGYTLLKQNNLSRDRSAIQTIDALLRGAYPIIKNQQQATQKWLRKAQKKSQVQAAPVFYSDWSSEDKVRCVADLYIRRIKDLCEQYPDHVDVENVQRVAEELRTVQTAEQLLDELRKLIAIETNGLNQDNISSTQKKAGSLTAFTLEPVDSNDFYGQDLGEIECKVQTGFPLSPLTYLSVAVEREIADPALVMINATGDTAVMVRPLKSSAQVFDVAEAGKYADARQITRAIIYSLGSVHGMGFAHNALFPKTGDSNVALKFKDGDAVQTFKSRGRPVAFFRNFSLAKRLDDKDQLRLNELNHVIDTLKSAFSKTQFFHIRPHLRFDRLVETEYLKGFSGLPYEMWLDDQSDGRMSPA